MSSKLCLKKARSMYEIELKQRYKENPTKELENKMNYRRLL